MLLSEKKRKNMARRKERAETLRAELSARFPGHDVDEVRRGFALGYEQMAEQAKRERVARIVRESQAELTALERRHQTETVPLLIKAELARSAHELRKAQAAALPSPAARPSPSRTGSTHRAGTASAGRKAGGKVIDARTAHGKALLGTLMRVRDRWTAAGAPKHGAAFAAVRKAFTEAAR